MSESVAIIGGGIGGLAAAHHLVLAGVKDVTVYEASDRVGGKAKSQYFSTADGTKYPGEHGFRFFPHFYRHLLGTLRQIKVGPHETVYDRLVGPRTAAIAYKARKLIEVPRPVRIEPSVSFARTTFEILRRHEISVPDATLFASRLLLFASSCQERRERQFDKMAWTEFTLADSGRYTPEFKDLAILASQNLSAMRAEGSSAATIGAITLQLLFYFDNDEKPDALLCGPTDEMWLQDWHAFLEGRGVKFELGKRVTALQFDEMTGRITGVDFDADRVTADHYVCAIPLECFVALLDDRMKAFDPALATLPDLAQEALGNMTGIQFFLKRPVPITNGHVHYPGTPFALTSVSQAQFWQCPPHQRANTPELGDILSVIISDWKAAENGRNAAGAFTDPEQLAEEVWRQMKAALPPGALDDDDVLGFHLDTNIALTPKFQNQSPLLIHPLDQLRRRPDAQTAIENFYLASDYVRTHTDLATMEGADEAARRATRAILCNMGIEEENWPGVFPLDEGPIFEFAKWIDRVFFRAGVDHPMLADEGSRERTMAHVRIDARAANDTRISRMQRRFARLALPQITTDLGELEKWERVLRSENDDDD